VCDLETSKMGAPYIYIYIYIYIYDISRLRVKETKIGGACSMKTRRQRLIKTFGDVYFGTEEGTI